MSLYGEFLKERENKEIIETEKGFITFSINGDECYIENIYVIKSERKTGLAIEFQAQVAVIAKERGCKFLSGSVVPSLPGGSESLRMLLINGFKLHSAVNNFIIVKKDLV